MSTALNQHEAGNECYEFKTNSSKMTSVWCYSVVVITRDFDFSQYSRNPGSNPGSTLQRFKKRFLVFFFS